MSWIPLWSNVPWSDFEIITVLINIKYNMLGRGELILIKYLTSEMLRMTQRWLYFGR